MPSLTGEVRVELRFLAPLARRLAATCLGQLLTAASFVQEIAEVISPLTKAGCGKLCFDSRLLCPGDPAPTDLKPDRIAKIDDE